ncbi:hypothetical protein [Hymenobacter cheonanensis]|uniref:hypothetical protein n=1 Tax=Hymenobacter sp. CA2-7 TaxID=3063993 RepID=UPI002712D299|nr:hypothetical protein [Hymenobacter sp. CA2-7]MDO7888148.1 hypothetical protein [Hymenobacter sp. CA2-7]
MRFILAIVCLIAHTNFTCNDSTENVVKLWNKSTLESVASQQDYVFSNSFYDKEYYVREFSPNSLSTEYKLRVSLIEFLSIKFPKLLNNEFEVIESRHEGESRYIFDYVKYIENNKMVVVKFRYLGEWEIVNKINIDEEKPSIKVGVDKLEKFKAFGLIVSKFKKINIVLSSKVCPSILTCGNNQEMYKILIIK